MKLPQLHLRDLFWLVLVSAVALGWLVERKSLIAQHERDVDERSKDLKLFGKEVENSLIKAQGNYELYRSDTHSRIQ